MTHRAKHLTISYLIVLAGVGLFLFLRSSEPTYKGTQADAR